MKFLVDENLSERVAELLIENGDDAIHVRTIGLATADDEVVMARAAAEGRVVVSADTDFGTLLARSGKRAPSVILFRLTGQRRAWSRAALVLADLPQVADDLEAGGRRDVDAIAILRVHPGGTRHLHQLDFHSCSKAVSVSSRSETFGNPEK